MNREISIPLSTYPLITHQLIQWRSVCPNICSVLSCSVHMFHVCYVPAERANPTLRIKDQTRCKREKNMRKNKENSRYPPIYINQSPINPLCIFDAHITHLSIHPMHAIDLPIKLRRKRRHLK